MCPALLVNLNMCLRQLQLESLYRPLRYVNLLPVIVLKVMTLIVTDLAAFPMVRLRFSAACDFGAANMCTICSLVHLSKHLWTNLKEKD